MTRFRASRAEQDVLIALGRAREKADVLAQIDASADGAARIAARAGDRTDVDFSLLTARLKALHSTIAADCHVGLATRQVVK